MRLAPTTSPCGYAKEGEADTAFEWLDKSADWGFGNTDSNGDTNIAWAKQDVDLESLREDPRFEAYLAKMTKIREAVTTTHELEPAHYIPEALADAEKLPLLVVLHDFGGSAADGVSGRWKAVADELGMALLAPSALYTTEGTVESGMSWFHDLNQYQTKYWTFEKPVNAAVSAFKKKHELDRSRVFIAGEGQGAMVAFNVGLAGPGLYKGVVALDGPPLLQLAQTRAPQAAKLGFRRAFRIRQRGHLHGPGRRGPGALRPGPGRPGVPATQDRRRCRHLRCGDRGRRPRASPPGRGGLGPRCAQARARRGRRGDWRRRRG